MQLFIFDRKDLSTLSTQEGIKRLESELLEEPSVLAGFVSLLELRSDHVTGLLLLHWVLQGLFVQVGLIKAKFHAVASGHQVVVVQNL